MPRSLGYSISDSFTDRQKSVIREEMRSLSDIVNVTFHEGRTDLRHVRIETQSIDGRDKVLGEATSMCWTNATLTLDRADTWSLRPGGRQLQNFLHELGHVLGLGHTNEDRLSSVMQSNLTWSSKYAATGFLAYDIALAQKIWGASRTSDGDNEYALKDGVVGGKK
ncbi:MAG TPA: matrixin family metalloprotease, partial [Beijerinckiaceae bacterium]